MIHPKIPGWSRLVNQAALAFKQEILNICTDECCDVVIARWHCEGNMKKDLNRAGFINYGDSLCKKDVIKCPGK
jgi:hypothetical protein